MNELADAGGGHVTQEPDGMATIDFTGRPGTPYIPPFSTAPVTVSRMPSLTDAASGLRDQAVDAGRGALDHGMEQAQQLGGQAIDRGSQLAHSAVDNAVSTVQDAAGLGGGAGSQEDAKAKTDEMYDEMLTRLRRDLLSELEAGGHLLRYDS